MTRKTPEGRFNEDLQKKLDSRFPGCEVINLDPSKNFDGIPDKLILFEDKWAILESKRSPEASKRLHQDYYVDKFNNMSFSAFINPDNCDEVLDALQSTFRPGG